MQCYGKELIVRGSWLKIAHLDTDKYDSVSDLETLVQEMRASGSRIDLFTFMQMMPEAERPLNYPKENDNLAVLPVTSYEDWWKQLRSTTRNRCRQAEKKGVTVREAAFDDEFARGIWEVYNETKVRQGKPNVHYGKDAETVRREAATFLDRSIFIGAYLDQKLIGFVKLVIDDTLSRACIMNIVSMVCHRDKCTTNALIAQCVQACADRGIPNLIYQNFVYANKDADTLTQFKDHNGFRRIDLPRYYVPLTFMGRFALRFGLHHGLVPLLPKALVNQLRTIRKTWYTRKLQTHAEASEQAPRKHENQVA